MQKTKIKYISPILKASEIKKHKLTDTLRRMTVKQFIILTTKPKQLRAN